MLLRGHNLELGGAALQSSERSPKRTTAWLSLALGKEVGDGSTPLSAGGGNGGGLTTAAWEVGSGAVERRATPHTKRAWSFGL